jgi:hypothetical protein
MPDAIQPVQFVEALALWCATQAALEYTGTPRAVWAHAADEDAAAAVYSVLRDYDARPTGAVLKPVLAMQWQTVGQSVRAVKLQSQKLLCTLLDADKQPIGPVTMGGFVLIKVLNLKPGATFTTRDERGRALAMFSFEAAFRAA